MNKNISVLVLSFLLLSFFMLSSCKKEEDKENPTISNLTIGPDNEAILYTGSDISFSFTATDNKELGSYQLRIFKDSKGDPPASEGWNFTKTYDIADGQIDVSISNSVSVPSDALNGNYTFRITVFDEAGNSAYIEQVVPLTDN